MNCCFRALHLENSQDGGARAFWNSEQLRKIRLNGLKGIASPECEVCWKREEKGEASFRKGSLDTQYSLFQEPQKTLEDGSMPYEVLSTEVYFSNSCQMQCRTCGPRFSSKWAEVANQNSPIWAWMVQKGYNSDLQDDWGSGQKSQDKILEFLREQAPHLRNVTFSGGEPLSNPLHIEALNILKPYASRIQLKYSTSLDVLPEAVLDLWEHFSFVRLDISIDGDRDTFNYIRHGGNIERVDGNIHRIQERFKGKLGVHPEREFRIALFGMCTFSVYNINHATSVIRLITELGIVFHSRILQAPSFMSVQVLPREEKQKIKRELYEFLMKVEDTTFHNRGVWGVLRARHIHNSKIFDQIKELTHYMMAEDLYESAGADFLEFENLFNSQNSSSFLSHRKSEKMDLPAPATVFVRDATPTWNVSFDDHGRCLLYAYHGPSPQSRDDLLKLIRSKASEIKELFFIDKEFLLSSYHVEVLRSLELVAPKVFLHYTTHLDFLTDEILELWSSFQRLHVRIPVEGHFPEAITVDQAIQRVQKRFSHDLGTDNLEGRVVLEASLTIDNSNIKNIIPLVKLITDLGMSYAYRIRRIPEAMSISSLPKEEKLEIKRDIYEFLMGIEEFELPNRGVWIGKSEHVRNKHIARMYSSLKSAVSSMFSDKEGGERQNSLLEVD